MPIPSVSSSTNTSSTSPAYAVVDTSDESKCNKQQKQPNSVEQQETLEDNGNINDNDTKFKTQQMEPDSKQDGNVQCKQKKRVLLLHARHEDDDKFVNLSEKRLRPVSISGLYAGSCFNGTQKCGNSSYEVNVELLNVDMNESTLCGYLKIKGLTTEFPELTTFFQAEVIGPKYSFHTRKWKADQESDLLHWKKFPSFRPYIDIFKRDNFALDAKTTDDDFVYMRWKETFLVPDHHVSSIHGASFAGFYYICYQRSTRCIKGYYFFRLHKDWFQELNLNHVSERGFGGFEFR